MYSYSAYGLTIHSEFLLPELRSSSETQADITIRFGTIDWSPPDPSRWCSTHIASDTTFLHWHIVGKFQIQAGREIIVEPIATVADSVLRLPLLGAVLAVALHQRHLLILHGSAVAMQDGAAIFVGPQGQGKSTMVATLCGQGHQLMADDVSVLVFNQQQQPILLPGFPQIKLWPEAAVAALGDDPTQLRRIHPEVEKRARPTPDRFFPHPLPVKRIYVLETGETLQTNLLPAPAAIVKLIANSYIPYFLGNKFLQTPEASLHFQQCSTLANAAVVYRLARPRALALLPEVAKLVETDTNLTCDLEPVGR